MKKYILILFFSFIKLNAQRNVILIIADDLGSDYCGFYENHVDTVSMPNVRKLLNRGVRFRYAWSNPLCSPTRAGILTGRYSFRTGMGDVVAAGSAEIDTAEITIPRMLKKYSSNKIATAGIGKWHLTAPKPAKFNYPNIMGYDYYAGNFLGQLANYYSWTKIVNGFSGTSNVYATIDETSDAINWIKTQKNQQFFLWLAYNAPHSPYHLPPTGLYSDKTLSGTAADITANPKAYFKAMTEALDNQVGRLFDSLQSMKLWDNTDIIFIGDNGDDPLVNQGTNSAKGSIYQDGISVPMIIAGPSVVNPNRVSTELVNTADIYATVLDLFGDTAWSKNVPQNKPVDSRSMMPILKNQNVKMRDWIFTEIFKVTPTAGDGKTMRNATHKLLDFDNGTQKFFKISTDPNEKTNLLTGTLNFEDGTNYAYLCNEMTKLVGVSRFCDDNVSKPNLHHTSNNIAYPNPFTNRIYLKESAQNMEVVLRNTLGQIVFEGQDIEKQNFENLPSGIYFLRLKNTSNETMKLIKH